MSSHPYPTTTTTSPSNITLYTPLPHHIPLLASLADASFQRDAHTQLKAAIKNTSFAADITPALESWLARPTARGRVVVATIREDDSEAGSERGGKGTGEEVLAGWACWAFKGWEYTPDGKEGDLEELPEGIRLPLTFPASTYPSSSSSAPSSSSVGQPDSLKHRDQDQDQDRHRHRHRQSNDGDDDDERDHHQPSSKGDANTAKADEPIGGTAAQRIHALEDLTNRTMSYYQSLLTPADAQTLVLVAVCVHPLLQGRGIGRRLVAWGVGIADGGPYPPPLSPSSPPSSAAVTTSPPSATVQRSGEEGGGGGRRGRGIRSWVSASHDGYRLFARMGYQEVGRLEVDLDEYAAGVRSTVAGRGSSEDGKWGEGDGRWGGYVWRWMERGEGGRRVEGQK